LRVRQEQTAFFVSEVARIQGEHGCAVAVDPKGPAGRLITDLQDAGVYVTLAGLDDRVQADSDLEKAITAKSVAHGNYPELNAAVDATDWRYVQDRRVLGRRNGEMSMLEAASLALWAATYHPSYGLLESIG
jgi:hypothetical protein